MLAIAHFVKWNRQPKTFTTDCDYHSKQGLPKPRQYTTLNLHIYWKVINDFALSKCNCGNYWCGSSTIYVDYILSRDIVITTKSAHGSHDLFYWFVCSSCVFPFSIVKFAIGSSYDNKVWNTLLTRCTLFHSSLEKDLLRALQFSTRQQESIQQRFLSMRVRAFVNMYMECEVTSFSAEGKLSK